jgi:hypothetical protein
VADHTTVEKKKTGTGFIFRKIKRPATKTFFIRKKKAKTTEIPEFRFNDNMLFICEAGREKPVTGKLFCRSVQYWQCSDRGPPGSIPFQSDF